jgi:MarR family transcriptional regulator, organic hydroperoxide resistance regulator
MIREQLKLENQLCFPVYAASRLITRIYQPYLDEIGITYPQYLVLLVLWEKDEVTVNEISRKLFLNTNTTTPLLKRLEAQGLITRQRSGEDERKVIIALTPKGKKLQSRAAGIPAKLSEGLAGGSMGVNELTDLKGRLNKIIDYLTDKTD